MAWSKPITSCLSHPVLSTWPGPLIYDVVLVDLGPPVPGELNCSSDINAFDIAALVLASTEPSPFAECPYCAWMLADMNGDGEMDSVTMTGSWSC